MCPEPQISAVCKVHKWGGKSERGWKNKPTKKSGFGTDKILQLKLFPSVVCRLKEGTRGRFWGWKWSFLHH